jgi:hypothetical protein
VGIQERRKQSRPVILDSGGEGRWKAMAEPIVFVSHFTVLGDTLNELKQQVRQVLEVLEAEKTRTTAQLVFLDETATKLSIVHVFADAEAMDIHIQGAGERAKAAYEFMAPAGWEIYGTPSDAALQMMRQAATSAGVALTIQPEYMGGFLRADRPGRAPPGPETGNAT